MELIASGTEVALRLTTTGVRMKTQTETRCSWFVFRLPIMTVMFALGMSLGSIGCGEPGQSNTKDDSEPEECSAEDPNADQWCHERYVENPRPDLDPNWLHPEQIYCAEIESSGDACVECREDSECDDGELCNGRTCYKFSE